MHSERKRIGGEEREQRRMPQFVVRPRPSVGQTYRRGHANEVEQEARETKVLQTDLRKGERGGKKVGSSGL